MPTFLSPPLTPAHHHPPSRSCPTDLVVRIAQHQPPEGQCCHTLVLQVRKPTRTRSHHTSGLSSILNVLVRMLARKRSSEANQEVRILRLLARPSSDPAAILTHLARSMSGRMEPCSTINCLRSLGENDTIVLVKVLTEVYRSCDDEESRHVHAPCEEHEWPDGALLDHLLLQLPRGKVAQR
jgi:hypothetical protein